MDISLVLALLIALGIGALIGLEREQSESAGEFAGIRTFPLIALLGALTFQFFPTILPIVFAMFLLLVVIAYISKIIIEGDAGLTTAIAAILTFIYGAMVVHSHEGLVAAIVLGTITAALLMVKAPLHNFANQIGPGELRSTMKFLIVALVILPLLPDSDLDIIFGLNPRFVWMMVVFVSGLGFLGYALTKILGPQKGIGLTGLFGGLVSSTATAMAMAERSRQNPELSRICAFATVVASIGMFARVLVLVAVVSPVLMVDLLIPIGTMMIVGGLLSYLVLLRFRADRIPTINLDNPFRLQPALVFGAFFAAVFLVVDLFNVLFGDTGIYVSAILAGTVDANAITLSLSKFTTDGNIGPSVAITGIVLAVVVNTIVKIGIVWMFGTAILARSVSKILGVTAIAGIGVILFI